MRKYKRKTNRGTTSQELLQKAADEVIKEGRKLKTVARELEICHTTLQRYVNKLKKGLIPSIGYKPRYVFTNEQEASLASYLLRCSSIYFGLLPEEVRKLAYECAIKFDIQNIPSSWQDNGMAGKDWFTGFIKRNPSLSVRTPEATSIGRATSFNKHNVQHFFEKLGEVISKHQFPPSRIWNLDETGVQTVLKPKKIIAAKGIKQVGALVSAERGTLVTVELAANALGNTIPPMFVFPRLKFKDLFIRDGPPECIGAGNSSGWMTSKEFLIYMDHFIKYTKPTPSEPVLLLLDNHSSHIDIAVVEKARENSIVMVSFPPHCTHHLQPLDVGVIGPFKTYCTRAQNDWMKTNPGKTMSIYEIPGLVKYAFPLAFTPTNICNAFKKTGIWPYNSNAFTDEDFAPSFVTDRLFSEDQSPPVEVSPEPGPSGVEQRRLSPDLNFEHSQETSMQIAEDNALHILGQCSLDVVPGPSENAQIFSPEVVRPFPKAAPRLAGNKRRIRKTAILTDTPEKNALAKEQANKKKKKGKGAKSKKGKENMVTKKAKRNPAKRKVLKDEEDTDSDDTEWYCIICCDAYSNSQPGEKWIECTVCKNWAHIKCAVDEDSVTYVCPNCDSEGDMSFSD